VPEGELRRLQAVGHAVVGRDHRIETLEDALQASEATAEMLRATVQFERDRAEAALHRAAELESELAAMRGRRAVRYADKAQAMARRLRGH